MSPAISKKQQMLMGADLARARAGKKTRTGMSTSQLKDFAETKRRGLPMRKRSPMPVRKRLPRRKRHWTFE